MWSEGVVFRSPPFYEYLSFLEGEKDLSIEHFVSELAVEALTVAIFPGATGFDVEGSYSCSFKPLAYSLGGEFRAVVRSDMLRWPMGHEEVREAMEHVIGAQLSLNHNGEALSTEFVYDRQNLDGAAVVRAVCPGSLKRARSSLNSPEQKADHLFRAGDGGLFFGEHHASERLMLECSLN